MKSTIIFMLSILYCVHTIAQNISIAEAEHLYNTDTSQLIHWKDSSVAFKNVVQTEQFVVFTFTVNEDSTASIQLFVPKTAAAYGSYLNYAFSSKIQYGELKKSMSANRYKKQSLPGINPDYLISKSFKKGNRQIELIKEKKSVPYLLHLHTSFT